MVSGLVVVVGILLLAVIFVGCTAGRCCPECPCNGDVCKCDDECGCYACEDCRR